MSGLTKLCWILLLTASARGIHALTCPDVDCDFQTDLCGWRNSDDEDYILKWTRDTDNSFARMDNRNLVAKGRLTTPWLDPQPGYQYQLQFKYLTDCSCKLELHLETRTSGPGSWPRFTGLRTSSVINGTVRFESPKESYRLHLDGTRNCGFVFLCDYGEVTVGDITCSVTRSVSSSSATMTAAPEKAAPGEQRSEAYPGRMIGAISASIIGGVIVVLIVVVVVLKFRKRREETETKPLLPSDNENGGGYSNMIRDDGSVTVRQDYDAYNTAQ